MVYCGAEVKAVAKTKAEKGASEGTQKIRVSVSLSPEAHDALGKIALGKKVSLGWVVREAVDEYLASKWPLFAGR